MIEKTLRDHLWSVMVKAEARGKTSSAIASEVTALLARCMPADQAEQAERKIRAKPRIEQMMECLNSDPAAKPLLDRKIKVKTKARPQVEVPRGSLLDSIRGELQQAVEEINFSPDELRAKAKEENVPVWRAAKMLRKCIPTGDAAEIVGKILASFVLRQPSSWESLDRNIQIQIGDRQVHEDDIPQIVAMLWDANQGELRGMLSSPVEKHALRVAVHRAIASEINKSPSGKIGTAAAMQKAAEILKLARGKLSYAPDKILRMIETRVNGREISLGITDPFKSLDKFLDVFAEQSVAWDNPHTRRKESCTLRKVLAEKTPLAKQEADRGPSARDFMEKLVKDIDADKAVRKTADAEPAIASYLKGENGSDWKKEADFDISRQEVKEVADSLAVHLQKTREKIKEDEEARRQGKPRTYSEEVKDFQGVGVSASAMLNKAYEGRDLRQEIRQVAEDAAKAANGKEEVDRRTEAGVRIQREARTYGGTPPEGWKEESSPAEHSAGRVVIQQVDASQKEKLVQQALAAEEKKEARKEQGDKTTPASAQQG